MKKFLPALAAAIILTACGSAESTDEEAQKEASTEATLEVATEVAQATVTEDGFPSGESLNGLKEILPSDIEPTFTKETVTKLNAIVRRSLDTIDAYDELRRTVKADRSLLEAPDTKAALTEMDTVAKAALADMESEVARLEASDEVYNPAVLAGMVTFVTKVEAEVEATLADGFKF